MYYDITLGERVDVVIGEKKCISDVQDITHEGTLVIAQPIYKGTLMPILNGELVQIVYYRSGGMLSFLAQIKAQFQEGEAALLELEIKSPISKYQRRDFVRWDTALPMKVRVLAHADQVRDNSVDEILRRLYDKRYVGIPRPEEAGVMAEACTSLDLSGGGMRFTAADVYEANALIECALQLGKNEVLAVDALVIRTDVEAGGTPVISVRFVNVDERVRRRIVKYIFDEQIKQRK